MGKMKLYSPMEKVIWYRQVGFNKPEFVIAWVIEPVYYPCMLATDGHWRVRVSRHAKDASNGIGEAVRVDRVQPYSEELCHAIEELNRREEEIWKQREQIRRGKIPEELL